MSTSVIMSTSSRSTDGEIEFDFDKWIETNNLTEVKYLFKKHNMTTTDTLTFLSVGYQNFMSDHELFIKHSKLIPKVMSSIRDLEKTTPSKPKLCGYFYIQYHC